jgi:hypothetical protein
MQPRLEEDALVFTAGSAFPIDEVEAWWLCFDSLRLLDDELHKVDALLADLARPRLRARRVAGIENPARLQQYIKTSGWTPVDTRIRVSEVASLVKRLGGEQLYGADPTVPLRELIQNAADAVRARRILDKRDKDCGTITVRLTSSGDEHKIEVEDNGVGMSARVVVSALLDFGRSYWHTHEALEEFPGLMAGGFAPTGRFGVGFFSIFMWGDEVEVRTRRWDRPPEETHVLEFREGTRVRPILRAAESVERLNEGGTVVAVRLKKSPYASGGLFDIRGPRYYDTLGQLCAYVAPALDVTLCYEQDDVADGEGVAVAADDWLTLPSLELLERVWDTTDASAKEREVIQTLAANMSTIERDGIPLARICLLPREFFSLVSDFERGCITVGGLRASSSNQLGGVIAGETTVASRMHGIPLITAPESLAWAAEQADLVKATTTDEVILMEVAEVLHLLGGQTEDLPVAETAAGWLTANDLVTWASSKDEVLILEHSHLRTLRRNVGDIDLDERVIALTTYPPDLISEDIDTSRQWPGTPLPPELTSYWWRWDYYSLVGLMLLALAEAWSRDADELCEKLNERVHERYVERVIGVTSGVEIAAAVRPLSRATTRIELPSR